MLTVLTTKPLLLHQASLLLNAGIGFVEYKAIEVSLHPNLELPKQVDYAIVTSKNAWRAIKDKLTLRAAFVVGSKTKALIEKDGVYVAEHANYASDLADIICTKHAEKSFVFFSGNKRKDTIPNALTQNKVHFREIEVYQTRLNPKKFQQGFDGVLFFSPSGVKSFTSYNSLQHTPAFCIGETTASEAKKHSSQVYIAKQAAVESVIVQVVKTLTKKE